MQPDTQMEQGCKTRQNDFKLGDLTMCLYMSMDFTSKRPRDDHVTRRFFLIFTSGEASSAWIYIFIYIIHESLFLNISGASRAFYLSKKKCNSFIIHFMNLFQS